MENRVFEGIKSVFARQRENSSRIALTTSRDRIARLEKLRSVILERKQQIPTK